jgi:hypothetical protein
LLARRAGRRNVRWCDATENGETRLLTAGVYRDTVRRTDKGWLLVKRHLDLDSAY